MEQRVKDIIESALEGAQASTERLLVGILITYTPRELEIMSAA